MMAALENGEPSPPVGHASAAINQQLWLMRLFSCCGTTLRARIAIRATTQACSVIQQNQSGFSIILTPDS
jgi:hypothetical protein